MKTAARKTKEFTDGRNKRLKLWENRALCETTMGWNQKRGAFIISVKKVTRKMRNFTYVTIVTLAMYSQIQGRPPPGMF